MHTYLYHFINCENYFERKIRIHPKTKVSRSRPRQTDKWMVLRVRCKTNISVKDASN